LHGDDEWIKDRALTLVLMGMFVIFLAGQFVTGFLEYNDVRSSITGRRSRCPHTRSPATGGSRSFENWESEFLADGGVRAADDDARAEGIAGVAAPSRA
jgi:hypothetical protein